MTLRATGGNLMTMQPYYDDGAAMLYHGDCVDVVPHLPPVNLMVTSPPYGELRDYGGHGFDFERVADALVPAVSARWRAGVGGR